MTEQQFTYWLQGFAELTGENPPTAEQWKSIREHLQTVFKKVTPPVQGDDFGKVLEEMARKQKEGGKLPDAWPPRDYVWPLQDYPIPVITC